MATVYRAVWTDDRSVVTPETVHTLVARWIDTEQILPPGSVPDRLAEPISWNVDHASVQITGRADHCEYTAVVRTTPSSTGGPVRTVIVQTGRRGAYDAWLWVEVLSEGATADLHSTTAPLIVRMLLGAGKRPACDITAIAGTAFGDTGHTDGLQLAADITDPHRTTPVIVIHDNDYARRPGAPTGRQIAAAVAHATAAIAAVHLADDAASSALTRSLGTEHGLWGGAMRIYLPGVQPGSHQSARRHRYYLPDPHLDTTRAAVTAAISQIGLRSAMRPAPARAVSTPTAVSSASPAARAEPETEPAATAVSDPDTAMREPDDVEEPAPGLIEELSLDLAVALERAAVLADDVAYLRTQLDALAGPGSAAATLTHADRSIPDSCASPSEAITLARRHLADRLIIPDTALVDLDVLDATVTATAWGQTTWAGLRALHAYAADRAAGWSGGGFWEWCKNSGHPRAWPATAKKLAMRESERIVKSDKLMAYRRFPVPTRFSATGEMEMLAHLKISEGGGNLAPRIYFAPDVRPVESSEHDPALVLVGFIGPHKYVPNTRT